MHVQFRIYQEFYHGIDTHKTKDQVTQTPLKTGVEHLPAALVAPLDNEYRLHSIFTNFYSFFCKLWNSFCKCVII
jgi:hypothetical protein